MESRVAVLEQIAHSTTAALDRIERRLDGLDRRMDGLEQEVRGLVRQMGGFEQQLHGFEQRFEASQGRVEHRLDMAEPQQHTDFKWLLGVMFGGFSATAGGFAALLGVMAHGFHWL